MNTHGPSPAPPGSSGLRTARRFAFAFAVGLCAAAVACIEAPAAETCPSGRYCPAGSRCAARQDLCIFTPCGDGKLDRGEVCDDGNLVDGDGCNASCTSDESCGNSVKDVNEECDFALTPDTCTTSCTSNVCGNGRPDPGEDCDPGLAGTTAQCLASCRWSRCGDGVTNPTAGEQCDDGNRDNQDDCTNACVTNVCGDGIRQLSGARVEECDQGTGNVVGTAGLTCDYGQICAFCLQGSCTVANVVGPHCGDGVVQSSHEDCDDARSAACGTCASCQRVWPRAAQGSIDVVNAASIVAGDTITIDDGTSLTVLDFSDGQGVCTTTGATCVDMRVAGIDNARVATQIRAAMSAGNSSVAPTGSGNPVRLLQSLAGASYNIAIIVHGSSVSVSPSDGAVVVNGMTGGVGCVGGEACASWGDCVSRSCSSSLCQ